MSTGDTIAILPKLPARPIAVAYDAVTDVLYWTDVDGRSIESYSLSVSVISGDRLRSVQTIYTDTNGIPRFVTVQVQILKTMKTRDGE